MPPTNKPIDAEVRIANLERAVAELRSGTITSRGGSVILPAGTSLTVTDPEGQVLATIGDLGTTRADGEAEQGFIFRRDNGASAISVQGGGAANINFRQFVAIWDDGTAVGLTNRPVVSTDAASGVGIATPYVPIGLALRYDGMPQSNRSDGGWDDVQYGTFYKQHPKVLVRVNTSTDLPDTTGEVRVLLDGVQAGATLPVSFSIAERGIGPFPVDGAFQSQHVIRVQARRVSGTGYTKAHGYALGVQS